MRYGAALRTRSSEGPPAKRAVAYATANPTKKLRSPSCGYAAATGPTYHDCCQNGTLATIPASHAPTARALKRMFEASDDASITPAQGAAHIVSIPRKLVTSRAVPTGSAPASASTPPSAPTAI